MLQITIRLMLAASLATTSVRAAGGCGESEGDRLNWARERMFPDNPEMKLVYRWLDNATKSCRESGDLWYYRSLVAGKLHDAKDEAYALGKARDNRSAALKQNLNPFAPKDPAPSKPRPAVREKFALVVGISKFLHAKNPLQFSGKDAEDFARLLKGKFGGFKPENVTLLTEEKATTRAIKQEFAKIRERAQEQDLVVVYISSHGWPRKDDPTGLSFVITHDTETTNQESVFATALQMVELAEFGRWLRAERFVLFLDTCYSGAASPKKDAEKSLGSFTSAFAGMEGTGSRVVFSASQADEQSWEDLQTENGYFTRFLLEGLKQNNGQTNLGDVFRFMQDRVTNTVKKELGSFQHPVIGSFGGGEKLILNPAPITAFADESDRALSPPPLLFLLPIALAK